MKLSEQKDLKNAIMSLPEKEKDKLLLRLIAKDKVLTEHLHFKLLEDEQDLVSRTENLQQEIDQEIEQMKAAKAVHSKDVLAGMRKLNGRINHHFKVTKDPTTEVELRIYLLTSLPVPHRERVFSPYNRFKEKLVIYFLKTTASVLKKYLKLHEDLQFDLKERFNAVLETIYTGDMANAAAELDLPKEI